MLNDSIHGTIEISSLEAAIIDSLEFSRLKDIKQLGKSKKIAFVDNLANYYCRWKISCLSWSNSHKIPAFHWVMISQGGGIGTPATLAMARPLFWT